MQPPARPPVALVTALNLGWAASRWPAVRRFQAASRHPARAQAAWLRAFLRANADTAYGRAHRYAEVTSPEDFRRRVPISTWDDVAPWVARLEAGERAVLTAEPVTLLERTSGSSGGPKHVPYTAGLLADFGAATGPWLDDVVRHHPRLLTLRQYWSVSPAARPPEVTPGGLRVGLEDDTEYFDPATRWALRRLMALDGRAARLRDLGAWRDTRHHAARAGGLRGPGLHLGVEPVLPHAAHGGARGARRTENGEVKESGKPGWGSRGGERTPPRWWA